MAKCHVHVNVQLPLPLSLYLYLDLTRMYNLVLRIPNGMIKLKERFGQHVQTQGLAAVEKCGEAALNVSDGAVGSILLKRTQVSACPTHISPKLVLWVGGHVT